MNRQVHKPMNVCAKYNSMHLYLYVINVVCRMMSLMMMAMTQQQAASSLHRSVVVIYGVVIIVVLVE